MSRKSQFNILFVNAREDSDRILGGDTIQFTKTKTALEKLGVRIEIASLNDLNCSPPVDIVHVFNIQMADSARSVFRALEKRQIPIILSPIYWDVYEYWFEAASTDKQTWRRLVKIMGNEKASKIYIRWQKMKSPLAHDWQVQHTLLEHARRVLPNSHAEAKLLKQSFLLPKKFFDRVDVVPNGIDPELFLKPPKPSKKFLQDYGLRDFILQVGTISPIKNQYRVIEALFDIPIPLVFIGQIADMWTEYGQKCKARAEERGNTIFIDRVHHEELPGIYALASAHVLPSWRETPGLASLEAAAAGCKIISTSIGSTQEYFGNLAWYCHPNSIISIRQAVEAALAAPITLDLREHILSHFTWHLTADVTLTSYQKTLDSQ